MNTKTRQAETHTCHGAIFCGTPSALAQAECPACLPTTIGCHCPGDCGCQMPAWMHRPVFCGCRQH